MVATCVFLIGELLTPDVPMREAIKDLLLDAVVGTVCALIGASFPWVDFAAVQVCVLCCVVVFEVPPMMCRCVCECMATMG